MNEKIQEEKAKTNKRVNPGLLAAILTALALAAGLILAAGWARKNYERAAAYERMNEDSCREAYTELAGSVHGLNMALSKLLVSEDPRALALALDDVYARSGMIAALMARVPEPHPHSRELNRLLIQTGDYARMLSASVLSGRPLSDKDRSQLSALSGESERIYLAMAGRLADGSVPVSSPDGGDFYSDDGKEEPEEFIALDYDGRYSDSAFCREPVGITGEELDEEQLSNKARELLMAALMDTGGVGDCLGAELSVESRFDGAIPGCLFEAAFGDGRRAEIAVTGRGGQLMFLRFDADTADTGQDGPLSDEERAVFEAAGRRFASRIGLGDTEARYFQYYPGSVLMEFVCASETPEGERVLLLADSLRIRFSRANGAIIGADASCCLRFHCERDIPSPRLSEAEAASCLSGAFGAEDCRLVLLAGDDLSERLCYEFEGRCGEAGYLILIDAKTGGEALIRRIAEDEHGVVLY